MTDHECRFIVHKVRPIKRNPKLRVRLLCKICGRTRGINVARQHPILYGVPVPARRKSTTNGGKK